MNIYVGNLPYSFGDPELKQMFEEELGRAGKFWKAG